MDQLLYSKQTALRKNIGEFFVRSVQITSKFDLLCNICLIIFIVIVFSAVTGIYLWNYQKCILYTYTLI